MTWHQMEQPFQVLIEHKSASNMIDERKFYLKRFRKINKDMHTHRLSMHSKSIVILFSIIQGLQHASVPIFR